MRHTRLLLVGLLAAALLEFWPSGGNPETAEAAVCNETGTIAVDTTWTSSCVHVVVDGITISPGVTLTIEPGTIVKLVNPSNLPTITVQGSLIAQGTVQDPVMLTSYKDDTAGGDSNGDGTASSAAPGDWNFIYLSSGSSAVFDHVMVRFGGRPPSCLGPCGFTVGGVITNIFGSSPDPELTFTNSTVSDSANTGVAMSTIGSVLVAESHFVSNQGTGLHASAGTLSVMDSTFESNRIGAWLSGGPSSVVAGNTFADNTSDGLHVWGDTVPVDNVFTNNQGYAIAADQPFWTQRSSPLFQGNTASGNRFNAILLELVNEPTVTTETNTLAANPTMPYVVNSLTIPFGATLTLEPGTVLKLGNQGNQSAIAVRGALVSHGTPTNPITFTSKRDDTAGGDSNGDGTATSPLPGDWSFVFLRSGDSGVGASASFDYTTVRYGGSQEFGCVGPCPVPRGVITNLMVNPFGDPPTTDPHASLSFANSTLSDIANTGINVYGASAGATVSQSRLLTGTLVAVAAGDGAAVDARNNWWGEANGPSPADSSCTTAAGSGSMVGCGVLFDPWLTSDPGETPTETLERAVIFIQGIDSESLNTTCGSAIDGFITESGGNRIQPLVDALKEQTSLEDENFFYFSYADRYCDRDFKRPVYEKHDTCGGILGAAGLLDNMIATITERNPGVKFDIVAHSMGGVVAAYWASHDLLGGPDVAAGRVNSIVTFDSPLRGTEQITPEIKTACDHDQASWQDLYCEDPQNNVAACPIISEIAHVGSIVALFTIDAARQDLPGIQFVPQARTTPRNSPSRMHCQFDDSHGAVWENVDTEGDDPVLCWIPAMTPEDDPATFEVDEPVDGVKGRFVGCALESPAAPASCEASFGTQIAGQTAMIGTAPAGATELHVGSTDGFATGDSILINPGMPNEEENQIVGFGSMILASPLQFDHEPGEPIQVLADSDADGVPDIHDACADGPEDVDGFEDEDGCPDPDNDSDGVLDSSDACPDDPEDMDGFEDSDGCPDPDNDGDGVLDGSDLCPGDPEDLDGFGDDDGCPDPDNDADGIADSGDACPNEPEDFDGFQDSDGCPEPCPGGDVNGDGRVDFRDVSLVARALGSRPGQPRWNPAADLNHNGRVDLGDLFIVLRSSLDRTCRP